MWVGVTAQFLVIRKGDSSALGLVSCYGADFPNGTAYLAAARFMEEDTRVVFLEGLAVFVAYVFNCWDFRKLYVEIPGFNMGQFTDFLGRHLKEEGRLTEHTHLNGKYWDQHIFALARSDWDELASGYSWLGQAES